MAIKHNSLIAQALCALALMAGLTNLLAEEHVVRMNTARSEFEPAYLRIQPGDTVNFVPIGRSKTVRASSILVPDGAYKWKSIPGKPFSAKLSREGVYLYQSDKHLAKGMVGMIQVGRPVNLQQAKQYPLTQRAAKTRVDKLLAQVKSGVAIRQARDHSRRDEPAPKPLPSQTAPARATVNAATLPPAPSVKPARTAAETSRPKDEVDSGQKTPAPSASSNVDTQLAEVTVRAFRKEYKVKETKTALGMNADIMSTPLSITVVPLDLLDDQQINNVEDALRNIAAVTRFKEGNGGEEKFSIRGFDASRNLFVDGARINNRFNATNIATTETANIERFEVLKGPSAILFGQGLPGGIINYVTKKPRFKPYASTELMLGNFGFKRAEIDVTGPINQSIALRGVVSYEDSDGFRDFDSRKRYLIYPAATIRLGNQTLLNVSYSYIRDRYTQDRGQALEQSADGSFRYSDFLRPDMFLGVPGWNDRTNSTYQRPSLNLTHEFSERWRLELIAAATKVEKELFDSSPDVVRPDGTVEIFPGFQKGTGKTRYLRLNNELSIGDPKQMEHRMLLSISEDQIKNDPVFAEVTGSGVVVFDPRTRSYTGTEFDVNPDTFDSSFRTDERERSVSFQDLITFKEKYVLLVGASRNKFDDKIGGTQAKATNPRLGVIYKATPAQSYYASYSRGFVPNTAVDRDGNVLGPERLKQIEVGAKYELFDRKLQLTGAVFDIRERGQAVTDPASLSLPPERQWSIALGETRSRGFEIQALGEIGRNLRLIAGYAYLDAKLIDDGPDFENDGNRLGGIPKHSGSLWAIYEFEGALKGFGAGGGVFAQSRVPIGFENRSFYDSWTQVDVAAFYKRNKWKLQFNAKNITDEEYLLTQSLAFEDLAAVRVGTATPRTYSLSLAREF